MIIDAARCLLRTMRRAALPARTEPPDDLGGWACVLWQDPLIIATWSSTGAPLGALSMPHAFADVDMHAFVLPSWTLEAPNGPTALADHVRAHLAGNPRHRITPVGSNDAEVAALQACGLDGLRLNGNSLLDEHTFRPVEGVEPRFDAVYNARLSTMKRHELASGVRSLALVYFRDGHEHDAARFHDAVAVMKRRLPTAEFINPLTDAGCGHLLPHEVNAVYASSRVGLCLSAVEGTNRASMEYLLAGLPVVSTRSRGGRDYFFDPDYCAVVDDDPRTIREAVDALVARDIPRDHIRAQTLARVAREREVLVREVQKLIDMGGGEGSFADHLALLLRRDGRGLYQWTQLKPFALNAARRTPSPGKL